MFVLMKIEILQLMMDINMIYKDLTCVPDEEESFEDKYVVTGKDFDKLTKKAKKTRC